MTVKEWIEQTKQAIEKRGSVILTDSELDEIVMWQATGWMASSYEQMADIADIQLAFASMLLHHAFAIKQEREKLVVVVHRMQGEGK